MSIWKELTLFFRDPEKFKYTKEGEEKAAEAFKKAFGDDEAKAKQFMEDLIQVEQNSKSKEDSSR